MLYKVTPMMAPPATEKVKKAREPGAPRKKRKTAIYDAEGSEVLITLMCLKCKSMKPLAMFGLRKMADGAIRNQPWCRGCRGGAGTSKAKKGELQPEATEVQSVTVAAEPADSLPSSTAVVAPDRDQEVTQPGAVALQPEFTEGPEYPAVQAAPVASAEPSAESAPVVAPAEEPAPH